MNRVAFDASPGFFLWLAVLFLWLPPEEALVFLAAAGIHEAGHLAAALAAGGALHGIRLGFFGWEMDLGRERLSYRRQIAVDLAGPGANFLACAAALVFFRRGAGERRLFFLFCDLICGAVQLLPAPGLDGGRALTAALSLFLSRETAERAARVTGMIAEALALAAGGWVFLETKNPSLLLFLPGAALPAKKRS